MLTNTGTLYYKAPEMFGSGFYSQSVDVWAIGVICYEMATGDFPFKNLYEGEIARQIK
jgi:serine/threonine protein kinase